MIKYPTRCIILDVAGEPVGPPGAGLVATTPPASRPHIGKIGWAEKVDLWQVRIVLDDGTVLRGSECWWTPIPAEEV